MDRQIKITYGNYRFAKDWRGVQTTVSELYQRLSAPVRSTETYTEYMQLPKAQQDSLKDVGGFVGGALNSNRRKAANVTGRDVITLDFDNIPGWKTDDITAKMEELGCSYCIYSTRKHTPSRPRLRVVIPLDRTVAPDEYEPIARKLAQHIGIEMADKTTFDVCRLMYWPSCCSDGEFYFKSKDAPLVSADMILSMYADWHDYTAWPQVPGAVSYQKLALKQGDPTKKEGIVGAFCRTYTITQAMEAFLPGIYEAVDSLPDRYTYLGGSTTGGAIIYEDDKFLYSHHATDPCGEKLVNAFDLVRLHMFGDADENAAPNTPVTKLPSFNKMCEFAENDERCKATLQRERHQTLIDDFGGLIDDTDSIELGKLKRKKNSEDITNTIENYRIILAHDPSLKDKIKYNEFANRNEVLGGLPWNTSDARRMWSDADTSGLYWYMEQHYGTVGKSNIDAALSMHLAEHTFNEVQDFIKSLEWDGTPRLDTLFIDYLGAEDTQYNRAVTRKMFTAAIARAMNPGCKFDNMLILVGPQGLGKSTILCKMSMGWFNDSIRTFEGKEASELLAGIWLVEISELDAFRTSEISRIKQYLSLRSDIYRAAYARNAEERARRCVFFGTTNTSEFLRDLTGNRRFWPVDTGINPVKLSVFNDLTDDIISQIWAEAKTRWQLGEPLFLDGEIEQAAKAKQEEHRESSIREGLIREFIEREIPDNWSTWSAESRRTFWGIKRLNTDNNADGESGDNNGTAATQPLAGNYKKLVKRDRVCAAEIWCECFNSDVKYMKLSDTREINAVLENLRGWSRPQKPMRFGPYGIQRGFIRV